MPVVKDLIRSQSNGAISFGDYTLDKKSKVSDFEHNGDLYKVKTFKEITKLEKNGLFIYESVPGTAVNNFEVSDKNMNFTVEGSDNTQITVELESDTEYKIYINDINIGKMKTNLGGKLMFSVELSDSKASKVKIIKTSE